MRLFKILIFCLILGFLNIYPPNILSEFWRLRFEIIALNPIFDVISELYSIFKEETAIRKQANPFVPARNNRTFDVISEVVCVLLRKRGRIEKKSSHLSQHTTSELLKRFPSTKGALWGFSKLFSEFFIKTSWAYFES